jgi:4,5-dihydroxyphthalate decarboxylase
MIVKGKDYEHTLAWPDDDPAYLSSELGPLILDILGGKEFDAAEFSLAAFLMLKDKGEDGLVGLPVFPARAFFHSCLWVRRDSLLHTFADLSGKRIGLRDYTSTTSVWFRGHIKQTHGVDWRSIAWVVGPNRRFPPPAAADITPASGDLEDMLLGGEIDAFFSIRVRDGKLPEGQRKLRPLLADPRGAERSYFRDSRLFPLLHMVVLSRRLVETQPDAARKIYDAYCEAKRKALARRLGTTFLPWMEAAWDETLDLLGADPMPYGLGADNLRNAGTLADYLLDQQLIAAKPDLAGLFVEDSWNWPAG